MTIVYKSIPTLPAQSADVSLSMLVPIHNGVRTVKATVDQILEAAIFRLTPRDIVATTALGFAELSSICSCNATSGAITVTLPALSTVSPGTLVAFRKSDTSANAVTIAGNGADTIHGSSTIAIAEHRELWLLAALPAIGQWVLVGRCMPVNTGQITQTLSTDPVTLNTRSGLITTASLTTAADAELTITLNNSTVKSGSVVLTQFVGGTNSGNGIPYIRRVTASNGSCAILIRNIGSAAFNGSLVIGYQVTQ